MHQARNQLYHHSNIIIAKVICFVLSLQLSQAEEYMRYRKLPHNIRMRVQEFYEHRYRKKYFNEETILEELSSGLKEVFKNHSATINLNN